MKTSELKGIALDWAVAKCEGLDPICGANGNHLYNEFDTVAYKYSSDWSLGGPIIERENISVVSVEGCWVASAVKAVRQADYDTGLYPYYELPFEYIYVGAGALEAAMRCYVASKLGDEVEIPEELQS